MKRTPLTQLRRAGFTLIELMIATAILGILASIALPKFGTMIDKAREAVLKGQLGAMRSALNIYYVENEGVYPRVINLPPYAYGIWHLHDKYIDFNRIRFSAPGYTKIRSGDARALYDPFYNPLDPTAWMLSNTRSSNLPIEPIHGASTYPSYFVWQTNPSSMGSYASIKTFYFKPDLSGRAWSLW